VPDVSIATPRGPLPAYVAEPTTDPPWPGVVVVHDFAGMSGDLRRQADWLASEGFLAVAPDLFHWGNRWRCLWTIVREIGAGHGRTFDDVDAARFWATAHPGCSGRMGIIGFCMGGGYAVALAPAPGWSAAANNYGGFPADAAATFAGACPMVGSFGGDDRSPMGRSAGERMERVLTELGIDHDVKIYPGVGHGFLNDHDAADQTLVLRLLARVSGTRYDAAATADARRRIAAFFDRHLRAADRT
jgi:carboxymethylenebutenolidase